MARSVSILLESTCPGISMTSFVRRTENTYQSYLTSSSASTNAEDASSLASMYTHTYDTVISNSESSSAWK